VGEALQFLDQSLDSGFRPGMGHVVPDRFFWALPNPEGDEGQGSADPLTEDLNAPPGGSRRVH
jgi:hydroxymethylpyrimidine/phosphomethylpyrimidine kinase